MYAFPFAFMRFLLSRQRSKLKKVKRLKDITELDMNYSQRNFHHAAIEFEQAVNANPAYGEAHYLLAQAYNVLNEYEKATSAYEKAP